MKILHYLPRIRLEEGGVVRAVLDICALTASAGIEVTLAVYDDTDAPADWRPAEGGRPDSSPVSDGGRAGAAGGGGGAPLPRPAGVGTAESGEGPAGSAGQRRSEFPTLHKLLRPSLPLDLYSPAQLRPLHTLIQAADAVHLHTPWDPANLQIARLCKRFKKPYILSIHGMLDDWSMAQKAAKKRLFLKLFARRLLEQAAAVHCTAEAEKTQSHKWFPKGRPAVIPLVFDLAPYRQLPGPEPALTAFVASTLGAPNAPADSNAGEAGQTPPPSPTGQVPPKAAEGGSSSGAGFQPAPLKPNSPPILLFLSRLHEKKGVEHLIRAAALLRDRGQHTLTLIAGTGDPAYEQRLRSLARERNLDDRVRFLGMVVGDLKVSLFQAADLFILPTSQENFGFVLVESLAAGTPAITTKGVDIWPELESTGAAIIHDRADPAAIADAVQSLLPDRPALQAMGEKGREWALTTFDGDAILRRYQDLYTQAATP